MRAFISLLLIIGGGVVGIMPALSSHPVFNGQSILGILIVLTGLLVGLTGDR